MTRLSDAFRAVSGAEGLVRRLIAEAAADNQYSDVISLAELAEGLQRLTAGAHTASPASEHLADSKKHRKIPASKAKAVTGRRGSESPAKTGFPIFERDGDRLIKVGWSKRQRSAYEHRAPRPAVIACVQRIVGLAPPGGVFAVDAMLPTADPSAGGDVPAYQVYLVVAWLRSLGLIKKKGRDGYVVGKGLTERGIEDVWQKLKERHP
jgi:hypothetical protein